MNYKNKIITIIIFSNLIYSCSSFYGSNKPIIADVKITPIPSSLITKSNENKQKTKEDNIIDSTLTPTPSVTPSINEQNSSSVINTNVYSGGAGTTGSTTGLVNNTWIDGNKLTIQSDSIKTEKLIRIGDPIYTESTLSPSISQVSIIKAKDIYYDVDYSNWAFKVLSNEISWEELKSNSPETPVAIRLVGKNYMMFNRLIEAKIDGELAIGHSTAISKDIDDNLIWESIIFIPNRDSFSSNTNHSITYSTPFGTSFRSF